MGIKRKDSVSVNHVILRSLHICERDRWLSRLHFGIADIFIRNCRYCSKGKDSIMEKDERKSISSSHSQEIPDSSASSSSVSADNLVGENRRFPKPGEYSDRSDMKYPKDQYLKVVQVSQGKTIKVDYVNKSNVKFLYTKKEGPNIRYVKRVIEIPQNKMEQSNEEKFKEPDKEIKKNLEEKSVDTRIYPDGTCQDLEHDQSIGNANDQNKSS